MFELPQAVILTLDPPGTNVQARLIRLTRTMAASLMDENWWNLENSLADPESEADRSWSWEEIIGEFESDSNREVLAVLTEDGEIQGAMVYRIDSLSDLDYNEGAVFGEYLATAPRNRPWLVNPPHLRGVGTVLLFAAVRHSYDLYLGGRVRLSSLPSERTRRFYAKRGFVELDENLDGTIDYELPVAAAEEWLREEGLL